MTRRKWNAADPAAFNPFPRAAGRAAGLARARPRPAGMARALCALL